MASQQASSLNYKHEQNQYKEEDSLVNSAFKELCVASDDKMDRCYEASTNAVMRRDEVGEELGYYQETLRKLNRADELKSLLQSFERSKKKNFSKAVYRFVKAIKTFAGNFNKNHGQYRLTNAQGIINGCKNPVVLKIMTWWQTSAKLLLLQILTSLKSQDKECNICYPQIKRKYC